MMRDEIERAARERREALINRTSKSFQKYEKVKKSIEEKVRNCCLLAAPTGCASFQLRFGASTLHRCFGIPVGFCGAWKDKSSERFLSRKTRLDQARLFIMDEMSMIGRQMLGKIEFKLRDTLAAAGAEDMDKIFFGWERYSVVW